MVFKYINLLTKRNLKHLILSKSYVNKKFGGEGSYIRPQSQLEHKNQQWSGLFNLEYNLKTTDDLTNFERNIFSSTNKLIEEAFSNDRNRKIVEIIDDISNNLCKIGDLAEFLRVSHPNDKFRKECENICINVCQLIEKLNTNKSLYNKIKETFEHGDKFPLSDIDKYVTYLFLHDFEQSGIHLDEKLREKVVYLNDIILKIGQQFVEGCGKSQVLDENFKIPKNLESKIIDYSYDYTSNKNRVVTSFKMNSDDPEVREYSYKLYYKSDESQEYLLNTLLTCRNNLAKLCGFNNYCERAIKLSIAETPKFIFDFLQILHENLRSISKIDFDLMHQMKLNNPLDKNDDLKMWDVRYYHNKAKLKLLNNSIDEYNQFSDYFTLTNCLNGIQLISNCLFNVSLYQVQCKSDEVWAKDIIKLEVKHHTQGLIGYIYCDFFDRNNKPRQDSHYTIQCGQLNKQLPIVVIQLNLNQTWYGNQNHVFLQPNQVDCLFHEMGHALHSMLAHTKYQHISGTRCSTDIAEIASLFFEQYASDPRIIKQFAKHYNSNESMNDEQITKLLSVKNLFLSSETQLQLLYSIVDHVLHTENVSNGVSSIVQQLQNNYYGVRFVDGTAWHQRFSHIVSYGSKYYSYLISKALSTLIWKEYFQADPLDRTAGEFYKREFLCHGGGKPSKDLIKDFLKNSFSIEHLVLTLVDDIKQKQKLVNQLL